MRIAVLLSSLGGGGAERVAVGLCNEWAEQGHSVTLVPTYSRFDGTSFYPVSPAVQLRTLRSSSAPANALTRLLALRRLLTGQAPDVVISFLPNVNIAVLLATAFTGLKCVIGERSDPSVQPIGAAWRLACSIMYRFADALTVQTEAVARKMPQVFGGIRRTEVMPNPLPSGVLAHQCDPSRPAERRILLSLGRLAPEKQLDQILAAFAQLSSLHQDWDLHVHGEGPLTDALAAQAAALGLQERVSFKGATKTPWLVMANADLFIMNSRFEGFPNALLEAMGTGMPCISSDCPSGPREISRDGEDALLFPNGDTTGMVRHLDALMGDKAARVDLGRRARASVIERYSMASVTQRWERLLNSLTGAR